MMSMLLSFGLFCACTKSDEVTDVKIDESSGYMVDFQLQNEDGIECYDFKEGNNIIFRLEIKNDTDEDAILPPFSEVLGLMFLASIHRKG